MKTRMLILAILALTPIAAYASDHGHQGTTQGMMHGKAEAGHSAHGGHAHAAGKPGDPRKVSRSIQVLMGDDMKFRPARVNVKRGETIRFVLRNTGQTRHEMAIGSMAELKQHAEMMRKMPGMEHDDPNQVVLDPGKSGDLIWQFTRVGTVAFACLQPGHFEASMIGAVSVK